MGVEERKHDAVIITRELLMNALDDPQAIIMRDMYDMDPDDLEHVVASILAYLDKTEPKKPEEEG